MTPPCAPMRLHTSYPPQHNLPPKSLDLLHLSSPSTTYHIVSAPNGAAAAAGVSWGARGARQQRGPSGTRTLGDAWSVCHQPPQQSKLINSGTGNNSPWKARTTQHLQIIEFTGLSGFLQDFFPSSLFQLLSPCASQ